MMHSTRRPRVVSIAQRRETALPWWALALLALAATAALPSLAQTGSATPAPEQTLPEVVRPRPDTPTLPPGNDGNTTVQPRSENPQVGGGRPVPDNGVIAPPVSGMGTTPVIPPPATGTMPVIPPPGSAGGQRGVVPK